MRDGRIVNRRTGDPIQDDERIFVFRAKDRLALTAFIAYYAAITNPEHARAVAARIEAFKAFAAGHPERMGEPDTDSERST